MVIAIQLDKLQHCRRYALVFLAATLSCTVTLKFAGIQYLEWIFAADLMLLASVCVADRLRLRVFRPFFELAKSYTIFLIVAFLLSLLALQQGFSYYFYEGILKTPVYVTLSRMAELLLDATYMLYLASLYREDQTLARFGARTYLWTGIAGCLYSITTLPLNLFFELQLGSYSNLHRFRGFNNEGGSFGVYLLSSLLLTVVSERQGWLTRREYRWAMTVFIVSLIGSQSKSAFLALAILGVIAAGWLIPGWKRWVLVSGLTVGLIAVGSLLDLREQFDQYLVGASTYREFSNLKWGDPNYVMGRVAGAVLAPRMIAARPLAGIGWGNYPLVRDNPEYRQGGAYSLFLTDAPGLGVVDYIVELGIPLWLYLTWIELKPAFMLRRRRASLWIVSLALILPVSTWVGTHLNLTHPWVVVAFALGVGYKAATPKDATARAIAA